MTRVGQLYRQQITEEIESKLKENGNVFLVGYSNVSGNQMNDFRKDLVKAGASVYVSKNKLARRALKNLNLEELSETVADQTAFIWSNADSVEVSKVITKAAEDFENLKVKGGMLEERVLSEQDVKALSELPSKPVLFGMLLGTIQAPLTRLAGALNAKSRDLLSILKQYSEKKGGS